MTFPFVSLVHGQEPVLHFKKLDTRDGVSDDRVSDVVQDNTGLLWFATRFGISKYDGEKVKLYPLEDISEVYDLEVAGDNKILVGTDRGVFTYNNTRDLFELFPFENKTGDSLDNEEVFCIYTSTSKSFWLGGSAGNFHYIKENKILTFSGPEINKDFPGTHIISISEGKDNELWLGTNNGQLWCFNPESTELKRVENLINTNPINDILVDGLNQLWLGTGGNGVFVYHLYSNEITHYIKKDNTGESINNNIVLSLYEGNNNRVFIGTDGGGINLFNQENRRFTYFKQEAGAWGLSDNSILSFGRGLHDLIWTGTVHGGINFFKDRIKVHNIAPEQLFFGKDKQSSRILEDSEGNLWVTAGRTGLRKYHPKTGEVEVFIDNKNDSGDLGGDIVLSLKEDKNARVWIGSLRGGLNVYDLEKKRFLTFPGKGELGGIYAIEEGDDQEMWVGTEDGIVVFDKSLTTVKELTTQSCPGLSQNVITSIYKDVKGEMWVGTEDGLNILSSNGRHIESFNYSSTDTTTLSSNHILSINEGPDLSVYIGTYGNGLNRYSRRDKSFERIGVKNGLNAKIIRGILIDDEKGIWLSTNLGLSRIKDETVTNFGIPEGITPFYGGNANLSRDGRIFFAGDQGLSYFRPGDLQPETSQPLVFFTSFKVVEKNGLIEIDPAQFIGIDKESGLKLQPGYSLFTVDFSSSNYFDKKDTDFFYQLEGSNDQWVALGNHKSLTFSNLAPGAYTLHVMAKNASDEGSPHVASVQFQVIAFPWERSEVQFLMFLFLGLAIFLIVSWRNKSIKKQRDNFKRLVAIRTAEVEKEKDRAYKNELELLKIEQQNEQLKQRRLADELIFKTEELTNNTLRTIHKNNLLVEIKENFIAETRENAEYNVFFKKTIDKIDDSLAIDAEWNHFYHIFNQVHPSFISSLKEEKPSLTDRELRLCALIKLNFPSHQIATLFGISLSSVKVARHRLRKKLEIQEGVSFEEFFDQQVL